MRQERKERDRAKSKSRSGRAKPIGKIAERRILKKRQKGSGKRDKEETNEQI